jgi:hypothetical protein
MKLPRQAIERITRSGVIVDIRDPGASPGLTVEDLAWAMSQTRRWGGHSGEPFSIARHSMAMMNHAMNQNLPPLIGLACLWHDAAEVFVGDLTTMLKHSPEMQWYRELEDQCLRSLLERFEPLLLDFDWSLIKEIDRMALRYEALTGFPCTRDFLDHEHFHGPALHPDNYAHVATKEHTAWLICRHSLRNMIKVGAAT